MPPRTRFASRSILPQHTHPDIHNVHTHRRQTILRAYPLCVRVHVCVRSRRVEFHLCARSYPQYACVQASEGRRRVIVSLRAFSPRIKNHTHARTHTSRGQYANRHARRVLPLSPPPPNRTNNPANVRRAPLLPTAPARLFRECDPFTTSPRCVSTTAGKASIL